MNTTPDSDTTVPPPPPAGGFFAWIRNLGIVRSDDRWFTGVASGIAAKANIDPLIVRGVFVVLALLGGPGILLYLVGWLLLPDTLGRIHVEEIIRGRAQTGVLITAIAIAAIVCIPVLIGMFFAPPFTLWGWDAWSAIGMPDWLSATIAWVCWIAILVFAGIWLRRALLNRGRAQADATSDTASAATGSTGTGSTAAGTAATGSTEADGSAPPAASAAYDAAPGSAPGATPGAAAPGASAHDAPSDEWSRKFAETADDWGARAGQWGEQAGAAAGRWGENVGRQADEWSARYAEHHDAHKLGAAHTIITIALALLAGGLTALWVPSTGAFADVTATAESATPIAVIAALVAALGVLAVSLIVAGIRGRHTGFVGFLAACAVVALLFTAVLPWGTRFQPFGTLQVDGLHEPGAVLLAGNARVDLEDLDDIGIPAESGTGADLLVWQLTGNATVTLPAEHPTVVSVYLLAGNVGEQWGEDARNTAGPFLSKRVAANLDGVAADDPEVAHVEVYMLAGNVRVVGSTSDSALSEEAQRNIEADTRSSRTADADTLREQRELEDELDRLEWQLDEPGLTSSEREDLEADRTRLERDLERLELEVSR